MSCGKRTVERNTYWQGEVGRKFGEDKLAEMLARPTLNQACWRCGKHFGLECLCAPCELRGWVEENGMPGCASCAKIEGFCGRHHPATGEKVA
jgi:hypothetical protein